MASEQFPGVRALSTRQAYLRKKVRVQRGEDALAQKQVAKGGSPTELLLAVRERNRRLSLEQYLKKIGLIKKFEDFTRKKDSKRR